MKDYSNVPLKKDDEAGQFEIEVDGFTAFIKFKEKGKLMNITHTEAPVELRGTGAAGALTDKVFHYLREHGYTLITECPYIDKYLIRHPEWENLKDESYTTPEPEE